jgi:hypothetical protein
VVHFENEVLFVVRSFSLDHLAIRLVIPVIYSWLPFMNLLSSLYRFSMLYFGYHSVIPFLVFIPLANSAGG